MKYYTMPYESKTHLPHRYTIEKAIKRLSDDYMINSDVMEYHDKIELLELIVNLTDILFGMVMEVDDD